MMVNNRIFILLTYIFPINFYLREINKRSKHDVMGTPGKGGSSKTKHNPAILHGTSKEHCFLFKSFYSSQHKTTVCTHFLPAAISHSFWSLCGKPSIAFRQKAFRVLLIFSVSPSATISKNRLGGNSSRSSSK